MALTLTMTTELEAVNQMLSIIGERPVNDLETTVLTSAKIAQQKLHYTSRKIQARGWPCNEDYNYVLTPDSVTNEIVIPLTVISIGTFYQYEDYTIRDGKLYNRAKQSFQFTSPVTTNVIWFQEYDLLPEQLKDYIFIVAARELQAQYRTSTEKDKMTEKQEAEALIEVRKWKIRNSSRSILHNRPVNRVINRSYNPFGMGG